MADEVVTDVSSAAATGAETTSQMTNLGAGDQQTAALPSSTETTPASESSTEAAPQGESQEDGILNEETKQEQAKEEKPSAPENYTFDALVAPEGYVVDEEAVNALAGVAKEFGLSQDAFNAIYNKMTPVLAERQAAQLLESKKAMVAEAKADADIGCAHWNETRELARRAIFQFTDPETRQFIHDVGLDCHPGFIKTFRDIARAISDDHVVRGGQVSPKRDAAQAFFYNSNMR